MADNDKITNDQKLEALMWCILESKGTRKRVRKDFWPGFAQKYDSIFGKHISPNGMRKKFFRWRIKMQNESTPDTITFFLKEKRGIIDVVSDWFSSVTGSMIQTIARIIDWFTGIDSEELSFLVCCLSVPGVAEELSEKLGITAE